MNYHFKIKGVIGSWWGTTADDIDSFLSKYRDKDVDVAICSPGGDVAEGLEIYQAFKDHGKVHAHIVGMTASIATIIAMGAKTVDMVKGSLILIHNCSTAVMEWRMANKEELDNIIAKYKKQRNDLNTIDDLMASIYSEKSGKTIQDCLSKMKTAAWLTAEDAKNFGLVDEIRADEDAKLVAMTDNIFSNNIIKEFGLPALPEKTGINDNTIVDSEGNPTESFLAKTWQGLKEHFRNNQASKSIMKGKFLKVAALLGYEALENKDGFVSLSVEDMEKLDKHISGLEEKATQANADLEKVNNELSEVKGKIKDLEDKLEASEETIKNLKDAPGADSDTNPAEEPKIEVADNEAGMKLFNAVMSD